MYFFTVINLKIEVGVIIDILTSNIIKTKGNATLKQRMNKNDKIMLLVGKGRVHTATQVQFLEILVMIKRTNKFLHQLHV